MLMMCEVEVSIEMLRHIVKTYSFVMEHYLLNLH